MLIDPYLADLKSQLLEVLVQTIGQSSIDDLVVTEVRESKDDVSLEFVSHGHSHTPRRLVATLRDPSQEESEDENLTEEDHAHAEADEASDAHAETDAKAHAAATKSKDAHGASKDSHGAAKDSHGAAKKPSGHAAPAAKKLQQVDTGQRSQPQPVDTVRQKSLKQRRVGTRN